MIALSMLLNSTALAQDITQIGRYSTVANVPTLAQRNPLLAVAQFAFNADVKTVGDGISVVLVNSGYQLAAKEHLTNEVLLTLVKPLPITQRHLGPLSIQNALLVLMGGSVFDLTSDPLHREINFKLKAIFAKKQGVQHAHCRS